MAVAVAEMFKRGLMYGPSTGTKKKGAVLERWRPLVEIPTYK